MTEERGQAVDGHEAPSNSGDTEELGLGARKRDDPSARDDASDLAHAKCVRVAGHAYRQEALERLHPVDGRRREGLIEGLTEASERPLEPERSGHDSPPQARSSARQSSTRASRLKPPPNRRIRDASS